MKDETTSPEGMLFCFALQCDLRTFEVKEINGAVVGISDIDDSVVVLEHLAEEGRPYRITHISGDKVIRSECYHIIDNEAVAVEGSKIDVSLRDQVSSRFFRSGQPTQVIKYKVPPDSELRQTHTAALAAAKIYVGELPVEQRGKFSAGRSK